jgi:dolichyl-diphosphooligosaccharide--protein glycosyltransferase
MFSYTSAQVGLAMSSSEERAYEIMRALGVDYILVFFGGYSGTSSDDLNKMRWMIRIAGGEFPRELSEEEFVTPQGDLKVGVNATAR